MRRWPAWWPRCAKFLACPAACRERSRTVPPLMNNKNLGLTDAQAGYIGRMRSRAGDPLLADLRRETEALGEMSVMLAAEEQGDFFTLLVSALRVKSALEVGTFTGFS